MIIEFVVLAIITIVGCMFILNARKNFSQDENKKTRILTADEQEPSKTDKFQVKAMLNRSSKKEKLKKRIKVDEQIEQEELPDPFAED